MNNRSELEALRKELGGMPPEALQALAPGDLLALNAAIRSARARQAKQLDEALQKALEHVPALMRLPIRKILGL